MKTKTKVKHTPGPWWTSKLEVGTVPMMAVKICNAVSGSDYEEAEANARLIAAAPELLTVLKQCAEALRKNSGKVPAEIEQAIDKAGG